ncbi:hypothetical protein KBZ14_00455 [Synechococcus sp. HJ21-Hayes]|jgi:hypothetical protein|uniref:hypothetical protein n=1 Tax=unclassified Synechococcus TaxID=2626047 RepID=UPI0020CDF9D1|nr:MULTISPECIES: hypothetical protein [unclassified Synechococcus]MCP9830628.1 hypothetical protein [Synechococcus sp. JJ3a-Johnson]MCP9851343.1 hypothetical protein [Synechococcus sp. HJ21-Hayes]
MLSFPGRRLVRPAGLALASMLLATQLLPPQALARGGQEGFGRWELRSDHCKRNLAESLATSPCQVVQLDQRQEGLLNVTFLARGAEKGAINQLTFVGELKPGSLAMRCAQARCTPQGSMQAQLSSVSETRFDGRGIAQGLPSAWPVNGTCLVEDRQVRCEAKALSGEAWTAEATTP